MRDLLKRILIRLLYDRHKNKIAEKKPQDNSPVPDKKIFPPKKETPEERHPTWEDIRN